MRLERYNKFFFGQNWNSIDGVDQVASSWPQNGDPLNVRRHSVGRNKNSRTDGMPRRLWNVEFCRITVPCNRNDQPAFHCCPFSASRLQFVRLTSVAPRGQSLLPFPLPISDCSSGSRHANAI